MNHKGSYRNDYGWAEAERELARGTHPEVVAARLGEHVSYVLEVADAQGWPIRWGTTPAEAKWIDA